MAISSVLGIGALLPGSLGFRNLLMNGAMQVDQRDTATTAKTTTGYTTDRWSVENGCDAVLSSQQSTDVPTGQGFNKSLKVTATTADTSIGSTQYAVITQHVEGTNSAQLAWGTVGAKTIVVSFWVKATVTGTYSFTVYNDAQNRLCPNSYTVNTSNTWEQKFVYISGDTSGTWLTTTGRGVACNFYIALGSSYLSSSGVWNSSGLYGVTGQANALATIGNVFAITGVQLEQNRQPTPFEQRPIGVELALCQRYYYRLGNTSASSAYLVPSNNIVYSASAVEGCLQHPVPMRISSVTFGSNSVYAYNAYQGNWVGIPRAAVSSSNSTTHAVIITDRSGGTSWSTFVTGTTQMAFALVANTSAGYIEVSAEL